jgi:4-amino-4-deoxy-L-arabinose transferase-like glycosyltransferase
MSRHLLIPLLALFLFAGAWLPRGLGLDVFVTPDEPLWLTTSANFYRAWYQSDYAQTYQREHPGVTIMYAGMFAFLRHLPDYPARITEFLNPDTPALAEWVQANTPFTALEMLVASRWWIALWIAGAFALMLFPARRLLGVGWALWVILWAAFDPFHIALSRQLHQDGLLAALLMLSLLALLAYAETGRGKGWLVLSSVVMGLAWLTKAPSGVFLPFGILLLSWYGWRFQWRWRSTIGAWGAWGAGAGLTCLLLWPALWVAPIESVRQMITVFLYYAGEGHGNGVFFLGNITPNQGAWYYPVIYLFRTTPVTLTGILLAGWYWWQSRHQTEQVTPRRVMVVSLLFALYFLLIMAQGAKQAERYILTTFLLLDMVAAWGWWGLVQTIRQGVTTGTRQRQIMAWGVATLVLVIQIGSAVAEYPYYFTYYNPLLGGRSTAEQVLTIGWGEGMEQTAEWINNRPSDTPPTVLSWYEHGSLSYYLQGNALSITETWSPTVWCETDYVVSYINQWQRHLPTLEADAYLATLQPVHRVVAQGIEYARIYTVTDTTLPDFPSPNDDRRADFGNQIRLTTVDLPQGEVRAGDRFLLTLNLQSLTTISTNYNVLVRLVAPDGQEVWRQEGFPWGAPTTDWEPCTVRPDGHEVVIPADALPGTYTLTAEFYDPTTFAPLPVTEVNRPSVTFSDRTWQVGTIEVTP